MGRGGLAVWPAACLLLLLLLLYVFAAAATASEHAYCVPSHELWSAACVLELQLHWQQLRLPS